MYSRMAASSRSTVETEYFRVTLAKIYLATGRRREGLEVIERLLQRNPAHPQALELQRQLG